MTDEHALYVPPHNKHAERAVLGAMLYDNRCIDDVADILSESDFYLRTHREIYGAIRAVADSGDAADWVTVSDRFPDLELAELAGLVRDLASTANVRSYAQAVRDRSIERQLIMAAADLHRIADGPGPVAEKLDKAQARVMAVSDQSAHTGRGPRLAREVLSGFVDALDQRFQGGERVTGLPTGLADLDELTAGLQQQDLIILAARPSMGKTTLALNIAEHQALKCGTPVAVFSLEMGAEQLVERSTASVGRLDAQRLRSGQLHDDDWPKVTMAVSALSRAPLLIDDSPALTIHDLRSRARRLKRAHDIGLVVVDYLQLMRGSGENRTQQIGDVSAGLKSLAKELRVPVVALSQLNRDLERRSNKRPTMADLRDSGNLEQDADVILFLYRDEVYNPDGPYQGCAELIVSKQRNGPPGTVKLTFLGHQFRFESFGGEWPAHPDPASTPRRTHGFQYDS